MIIIILIITVQMGSTLSILRHFLVCKIPFGGSPTPAGSLLLVFLGMDCIDEALR